MNKLKVLFFEVTSKCNAHCEHCGSRCDINSQEGISSNLFKKVLLDVKQNFGTDIMLNITGGEPLIRNDLFEITSYAKQLGFDWGMVTNGTLITDEKIKKMKSTGMSTISISIDGMKNTHENFRHLPNSFDNIIRNIQKLQKANFLEHIQITFIANKKNINELPALWRMLNNLKIDSLRISCIDPIGRAKDNQDLLLEKKDFEFLFSFIKHTNQKNQLPCIWSCSHYFGNTNTLDIMGRHFECYTGKNVASILSNGDIFACPNIPRLPYLIQGNIKNDKFSDVWKDKFIPFRNRKLNEKCNNCENKKFCNGDSFHTWNFEENKPNFCYKEVFKNEKTKSLTFAQYKNFLNKKYGKLKSICLNTKSKINVIFEPNAYEELKQLFHINKKHPLSMYEQQVGLVGFELDNNYIIKYVFPSYLKNRTRNMGYVDNEIIQHALDESEIIKENFYISDDKDDLITELKFLGFAHSHPLDTEFALSEGDVLFQEDMAKKFNNYISILINPTNGLIASFINKNCEQSNLQLLEKYF